MPNPITTPGYRYATRKFVGDGSTVDFEFSFAGVDPGYISRDHVQVTTMDNSNRVEVIMDPESIIWMGPNQIRIPEPQPNTKTIIIRRETPKDMPLLDFNDGAILNETNLNMTSQQAIYATAEMVDRFADMLDIFSGVSQDVINALNFAILALERATLALELAQQALDRANEAYDLAMQALNLAQAAWDLANSKPDSFLELNDTPNSYAGEAGNVAIVNASETGMDLVPVEEIPGLIQLIEDHGGGGGEGLPLDLPVLLHEPDSRASNGSVLMAGTNVNFTYTVDGNLVVNSSGGGTGDWSDLFSIGNDTLNPGDFNGAWADPTGNSSHPPSGTTQPYTKNSFLFGVGNQYQSGAIKLGVGLAHQMSQGVTSPSVSIGKGFEESGYGYSNAPDIDMGVYLDRKNIFIGSNIASRYGYTNTNLPEWGVPGTNHYGNIHIGSYSTVSTNAFVIANSVSICPYYTYHSQSKNTGDIIRSWVFGSVDLGDLPNSQGFEAGDGSKIFLNASLGASDTSDGEFYFSHGTPNGKEYKDFSAGLDNSNSWSSRLLRFDMKIMSESSRTMDLFALVRVESDGLGGKSITIVNQASTDVYGTGASGVSFQIISGELRLVVANGNPYNSTLNRCMAYGDRIMMITY